MLSKNNSNERKRKSELQHKQEHFSLRKLTIGTTSVLLGFSFIQANSQVVKADTIKGTDETNVTANKTSETATKQKEAVPVKSKQADLATYAGLTSFLRGELEVPEESQGSTSSAAASSTSTAESGAAGSSTGSAATSAASSAAAAPASTAASTGVGSAAADSAASVGSTPAVAGAEKLPAEVEAQDEIVPRSEISGTDGDCSWTYDSGTKALTYTGTAGSNNTLSSTSVLNLSGIRGVVGETAIKEIDFDNTTNGRIKLNANSSSKFAGISGLKGIEGLNEVDTSAVQNMNSMFSGDERLLDLNLDGWDMTNVQSIDQMFYNNKALKTLTMAGSINGTASASRNILYLNSGTFYNDTHLTKLVLPRIRISNLPYNAFYYFKSSLKTLDVSQLDTTGVTNFGNATYSSNEDSAFSGFTNLENLIGLDNPTFDVSQVTNMANMFRNDPKLTKLDLHTWDTRNLAQENYDGYAPGDTTQVGSAYKYYGMARMFEDDSSLQEIILGSNWNTRTNYSTYHMFSGDTNLQTIKYSDGGVHTWDMGHVAHAEQMFYGTNNLMQSSLTNIGLSNWNTGNLHNATSMFAGIGSLTKKPKMSERVDPLKELDLSAWDTSQVTDMSNMFAGASTLEKLNLGLNGVQHFTTSPGTHMSSMFSGIGTADDHNNLLHLTLGDFRIDSNAWTGFDTLGLPLTVVGGVGSDTTISLDNLKTRYAPASGRSDTNHTYILEVHRHDNTRYALATAGPTVEAHIDISEPAISAPFISDKLENLSSVGFVDSDDSSRPVLPIASLQGTEDYFDSSKGIIQKITWEYGQKMDRTGTVVSGGVIADPVPASDTNPDHHGTKGVIIPTATNYDPSSQRGNAVVEVTFGDGSTADVPVIIQLPNIVPTTQQYIQAGALPSPDKAKDALQIDGGSAPNKWGKWSLAYSWAKKDGNNWRALLKSDITTTSDMSDVGIRIDYTTANGDSDGYQIIKKPSTWPLLVVKNYALAYKINFNSAGLLHMHEKTSPTNPHDKSFVDPPEFTDHSTWSSFLTVTPRSGGPAATNLSEIIKKIEWETEPSSSDLQPGNNNVAKMIKITYQDDDSDSATPLNPSTTTIGRGSRDGGPDIRVNLSAGRPSGSTTSIHVNHSDQLDPTSALAALDSAGINPFYTTSYSWSKDGKSNELPDVSSSQPSPGEDAYIIINYHDRTKQAVKVKLEVLADSDTYTPSWISGQKIIIHATDSGTGEAVDSAGHSLVPIITNSNGVNNVNTLLQLHESSGGGLVTPPSTKIAKIVWHKGNGSPLDPDDEPDSAGSPTQNHKIDIVYNDSSVDTLANIPFVVEKATASANLSYTQGQVPAAIDAVTSKPADFNPIYKWVKNNPTHDELTLPYLNSGDANGTINAAIEVTYSDNTHQYLPVSLTIGTRASVSVCTPVDQTVNVGGHVPLSSLVKVEKTGGGDISTSEYELSWEDGAPDLTAANLGNANEKKIHKTIKVTFNRGGGSFQLVPVTITLVGAQLNPSAEPKKAYLGSSGMNLSEDNIKDIASYYLDTSKISSLPTTPTYELTQTGDTVTLTVNYGDNSKQVFTEIPLELVRGEISNNAIHADRYTVFGPNEIKQVLLNYDKVASTGATIDDTITGINLSLADSTHPQIGSFKIYYPADSEAGLPEVSENIPVKVIVGYSKGDDPKAVHSADSKIIKLLSGSVIVPQHTDLAAHNEYAKGAVTSVNAMPDGCEYVWDKDHIPATDKEGTYSSFVNVRYPNGTFVSVPVKVTVVGPTLNEAILMHNSYIYNQDANRVTNRVLQQGLKVKTYGTALLEGKLYYHLEGNQYVKAGNIDGQKRKLIKTSYVYDKSGQRIADKTIYEGTEITTYGARVKIKHGKYYAIGINEFIKADAVNKFITEKS
ncbi:BspA family leucine-rich repeat surface protein [Lactobacillus sp. ESL0791]|uniref:BspA family leucine-rich repeat surface protein n=1 Tax=Lactobacillus sp. ESL0791 TaxID=2983234 RepID=UPI0023F9FFAF|nr:BspA family leucine-rich repeat surface protein [Lactobacillus sp. ESL0791]MDF7639789.1 BspA family leucine-rich repeat surface protein [Lactobacillus sp. ESL0791]